MTRPDFHEPGSMVPASDPARVQLWRVKLDQPEHVIRWAIGFLDEAELERANRFYFPHLRTHFIAARAALRHLAGALSGRPPEQLVFAYTQHEKPYLPGSSLHFNVSHANTLGLIALAPGRKVGVDIEHARPRIDRDQIARRFFSPAEVEDYLSLSPDQRPQAFYNCWTRKEAYIKAIGEGLSFPLDQFRVSLVPGEPARLLAVYTDPAEAGRWKMIAVAPGDAYTAALIAEGQDWSLEAYDFSFPIR